MYSIMIIEDDEDIREELKLMLENALYKVTALKEFDRAEEEVRKNCPDLILLDINLPGTDGMKICRRIRRFSEVPVIFVTSRNSSMDELNAIMTGGDDYITKPYNMPVLMARIQAVLKRTAAGREEERTVLNCRGAVLNLLDGTLSYGEEKTELTRTELRICYHLFCFKGQIVSRADLIENLWEDQIFIDDNTLSVNMTRIRGKFNSIGAKGFIETKRGQGYKV